MLIFYKAGIGKTALLTHLSKRIMKKFSAHWLVRINLNGYKELLKDQKGKNMHKGRVFELITKEVLNLESYLEELFKKYFEGN